MSKRRINVRAVVVRDNKILAVKHKDEFGNPSKYWALPGGGLDPLESLYEGLQREVMEELGVQSSVSKLLFVQQFMSKREGFDEELEFHFLVEDSPLFDSIDLTTTSHGNQEISVVEFVDPRHVTIMPRFLSEVDIQQYAEQQFSPYIFTDLSK